MSAIAVRTRARRSSGRLRPAWRQPLAVAGAVIAVAAMRSHSERRPDEVPVEEPAFQEAA